MFCNNFLQTEIDYLVQKCLILSFISAPDIRHAFFDFACINKLIFTLESDSNNR
jgi:hypothetical protein